MFLVKALAVVVMVHAEEAFIVSLVWVAFVTDRVVRQVNPSYTQK
jgi:hypothetical protein